MFGIGMNEMLIIAVIAVIIIGPKQIPEMARALGKMFSQFKRASNDLRSAVNEEIQAHEEINELKEIKDSLQADMNNIGSASRSIMDGDLEEGIEAASEVKSMISGMSDELRATADEATLEMAEAGGEEQEQEQESGQEEAGETEAGETEASETDAGEAEPGEAEPGEGGNSGKTTRRGANRA